MNYDYSRLGSIAHNNTGNFVSARYSDAISAKSSSYNPSSAPNPPSNCPDPPNPYDNPQEAQRLDKIAEATGMSQTCRTALQNEFANSASSASASRSNESNWLTAARQASASFARASASGNSTSTQEGCGSAAVNLIQQESAMYNVNCILSTTNNTFNHTSSNTNTITVSSVCPEPVNTELALARERMRAQRSTDKLNFMTIIGNLIKKSNDPGTRSSLERVSRDYLESYNLAMGGIDMSNVHITNSINAMYDIKTNLTTQDVEQIESSLQALATSTAENTIQNTIGVGAVTPAVQQLTQNRISNRGVSSSQSINEIINSTNVSQDNNGNITIASCNGIKLRNVIIDNRMKVRMATEQLAEMARERGVSTAMELVSEATSSNRTSNDVAGLEDIAEQANIGNAAIADAGLTAARNVEKHLAEFSSFILSNPIVIIIAVVVLFFLLKKKKN
jgi:hypothetical protein